MSNRCNGCSLAGYKKRFGENLIKVGEAWYLKGLEPVAGQGEPFALPDGTPIRFVVWFMSEEHSNSCLLSVNIRNDEREAILPYKLSVVE
mgnify:CR=1 FL=1